MRFDCIVIIQFTLWVFFSCSRSAGISEQQWNPQVRAEHVIYHISTNDPCNQLQINSKASPTRRSANDKTLVTSAPQRPNPDEMCQMGLTSLNNLHWTRRDQDCAHAFSAACRPYKKGISCTVLVKKRTGCCFGSQTKKYSFSHCTKTIVNEHATFLKSEEAQETNEYRERKAYGKSVATSGASSSSGGSSPPVSKCDCRYCVSCTLRQCPGCPYTKKTAKPIDPALMPAINYLTRIQSERFSGNRVNGYQFPLQPSASLRYQTNGGSGAYGAPKKYGTGVPKIRG